VSDIFPERLKAARELRKLSQGEIASRANLPPTSISHFESGSRKPSFDNLRRLAQALGVTTDYLLGLADQPEVSTSADPLYRHGQQLSSQDRDLADQFLRILAERNQNKGGSS
jgi:transcriptional regulator with XRE-family HTH domain